MDIFVLVAQARRDYGRDGAVDLVSDGDLREVWAVEKIGVLSGDREKSCQVAFSCEREKKSLRLPKWLQTAYAAIAPESSLPVFWGAFWSCFLGGGDGDVPGSPLSLAAI